VHRHLTSATAEHSQGDEGFRLPSEIHWQMMLVVLQIPGAECLQKRADTVWRVAASAMCYHIPPAGSVTYHVDDLISTSGQKDGPRTVAWTGSGPMLALFFGKAASSIG
jgi:hypothetical protein